MSNYNDILQTLKGGIIKMIDEINYTQKVWNENDVVTDADLNRIESGISDVTQYANAINEDTDSRLTQLGTELEELRITVAANKTELLGKISDVKNDVVLQSDFESTLKTGIAPLLVTDSTTHLAIKGAKFTLENKNTSKNLIKYAYYKRSSTATVNISVPVSFDSERYSFWKYKTYQVATLDEGTSDMSESDLSRFGYLSKSSGTGSTNISFYIEGGKLMAKVGLLGGGLISVNFEGTIYFRSYNDSNYISY